MAGFALAASLAIDPRGAWAESAKAKRKPAAALTILVVGDSLSAEYGLVQGTGWVALLQSRLRQQHIAVNVINASISGDTTAGGRSRLPVLLATLHPQVVVIELGGNDALRGTPLSATRQNITAMVEAAKTSGAKVLIVGMELPPNYGRSYSEEFAGLFAAVAKSEDVALVPFMLEGVADGADAATIFQSDRIHPLAAAHPRILENIWPVLRPLLR